MPRPRAKCNKDLPANLRVRKGLYSYESPLDRRTKGLGRDRVKAIIFARSANAAVQKIRAERAVSAEEWARGLRVKPADPRPYDPKNPLTLEQISQLQKTSTDGGLYFLLLDGVLQYVGISRCVFIRLERHAKEARIPFNETRCMLVPETAWRRILEQAYIERYLPPYNIAGKPRPRLVEPEEAAL